MTLTRYTSHVVLLTALATVGCSEDTRPGGWNLDGPHDPTTDTRRGADVGGADLGAGDTQPEREDTHMPDADVPGCDETLSPTPRLSNCESRLPDSGVFGWQEGHTSLTSLELGPTGCPRVLYEQGERVEFAEWTGSEWSTDTVGRNRGVSSSLHLESELAVDACDRPSVAYIDENRLHFARRRADGEWRAERIPGLQPVEKVAHAIDPTGRPVVIAERISTSGRLSSKQVLAYAVRRRDGWRPEQIHRSESDIDIYDALEFDARGRAHVAFVGGDGSDTVYHAVTRASGDWRVERVDEFPSIHSANLAVDENGRPHIVTVPGVVGEEEHVHHLYREDDGWSSRAVDRDLPGMSWGYTAAFDDRGRLHTAYLASHDTDRTDLRYAVRADGDWRIEVLETRGYMRPSPRLVPDARLDTLHTISTVNHPAESHHPLDTVYTRYPLAK